MRHRRLRHYLVGSPDDTQHAIDRLHLLGYLERVSWSHAIAIPANGLIIRPDAGDVLRYSQRDRPSTEAKTAQQRLGQSHPFYRDA
jgi:hypothetical protein